MNTGKGERRVGMVSLLTVFALFVHGYHPFAEDGGLYVAGIKRSLDPALYGPDPKFVLAPTGYSAFAPLVAEMVRISHVPLEWALLLLYAGSVWATLYAGWMVAARVTRTVEGRQGAVALLACWLTLPIAGTSLMLADPYLTARSLATPLVLAAIAGAMDAVSGRRSRARKLMSYALIAATVVHPLMGVYGWGTVVALGAGALRKPAARWRATAVIAAIALGIAAAFQWLGPRESSAYAVVVRTRYYWFLSQWHWYEWLGIVAPLAILAAFATRGGNSQLRALARGGLVLGGIAAMVALGFAHLGYATHMVARLQPLRCFQMVYMFMILLLGAWLGERVLRASAWRWALCLVLLGTAMFAVQRAIYPASRHLELPEVAPVNAYAQAFVWIRANTPEAAVFAMDPHYIQAEGEDAQSFRAIAERNALPDYSKDGGEAAITPRLTEAWTEGQAAQSSIEVENDEARTAKLKPLGVSWVVLRVGSATDWSCPYRNASVKVCELR